jgi:fucose 4-O-acetylase-like acetyltransferase
MTSGGEAGAARDDTGIGARRVAGPQSWVSAVVAATAGRDRFADALRVTALAVVVLGHWILTLVVLDGTDAFAGDPWAQAATWAFLVMPVFFLVGGFAHAASRQHAADGGPPEPYAAFLRARTRRLLDPVAVFLAVWVVLAVVLGASGAAEGAVGLALDRAPTPLWFLAVYLVVVALAPAMLHAHRRFGVAAAVALAGAVVALDLLRFHAGAGWTAGPSLLLVWLAIHQLGFLWADGTLTRGRTPAVLAVAGLGAALVLTVGTGWYPADMLGLPGSSESNFRPPTVALLAHGTGYVGLLLALRRPVERLLAAPRVWACVVVAGSVGLTVYCWHLTAAFAVQGMLLLAGTTWPSPPAALGWLLLPVFFAVSGAFLVGLVLVFRRWETARPRARRDPAAGTPSARHGAVGTGLSVAGVVLAAVGLLVLSQVGLDSLVAGEFEDVFGVPLAGWEGLLAFLLGLGLVRPPPGFRGDRGPGTLPGTGE